MTKKSQTGKLGESLAADWLLAHGTEILELNWRSGRSEIDIIGKEGRTLIFFEVKTRSSDWFSQPEDSVGHVKMKSMSAAALAYIEKTRHEGNIRFDVISIVIQPFEKKLFHQKDAFFPF